MIGIISQNNILKEATIEILNEFSAESYQEHHEYQLIILLKDTLPVNFKEEIPVIAIGCPCDKAILNLSLPLRPVQLIQKIETLYKQTAPKITFENKTFLFYKSKRCLETKGDGKIIPLTEKESEILTYLADNFPKTVNREDLLQKVWNYHQDTETHTVESHIYTLRQKLGEQANKLIQSSPIGYSLAE